MYHIVWGLVIGLLFGLGVWKVFFSRAATRTVALIVVAFTIVGAILGAVNRVSVCKNLTVATSSSVDGLRELATGLYYSNSDNPILEKSPFGNPGGYVYLYRSDRNALVIKSVLDTQADISVVNDNRMQVEIITFRPSSTHCDKSDELVLPKDKYIFHVPANRYTIVE